MKRSLEGGEIVPVQQNPPATDCDALQTMMVAPITFAILQDRKATGIAVSPDEVHHAMRVAFARLRFVVEPGGAVALAAALAGKLTLSGGNVDRQRYAEILAAG